MTQADLDHGSINDSATATGTPPTGPNTTSPPATVTVPAGAFPALTITKSATPTSVDAVGQTVTYQFTVKNTGNVDLTAVHVIDTQGAPAGALATAPTCQSLASPTGTCSGPSTSLAPGQSASFVATYTVTQADLDHGSIHDSATATGTPPTGPPTTSPPGSVTEPTAMSPALTITKSATPTSVNAVGQTVTYHFTVTNTGNVDLTAVHVTDTQTPPAGALASGPTCQSLTSPTGTCSGSSTSLAPGQSATFVATYTVTQTDLNHGSIKDSATATGTPPSGPVTTSPPGSVTVPTGASPALRIVKSATPTSVDAVGQTVTYHFKVKNTGNVTLTNVHVTDKQLAPAGKLTSGPKCQSLASPTGSCSGASTKLLPGQSATFVATYKVTQADLSHGSIKDSATATGTPPSAPAITSPPAKATVTATVTPGNMARLTLTKVVDRQHALVGDLLHYKIVVVNHGPDPANNVVLHDTPSLPMSVVSVHASVGHCSVTNRDDVSCQLGTVANGGQVTITVAAYALAVGTEIDTAKATTTSHNPNPGGAIGHATTKIVSPLSLTKTAKPTTITTGQSATFTITVKNLSSRTLNNVLVCDTLPAGLLYVSSDPRSALHGESHCWTTRHLPGHAVRSFKLVANAGPGNSHRVVNVATVQVHGLPTLRAQRPISINRPPPMGCTSAAHEGSTAGTSAIGHAAC